MTERLHHLIDSGADQPVINERIASLMEADRSVMADLKADLSRIGTDHEKRLRFMEKTVNYTLGAVGLLSFLLVGIPEMIKMFK